MRPSKTHRIFILPLSFSLLLASACTSTDPNASGEEQSTGIDTSIIAKGEALFKSQCYSCHNDFAMGEARLAPPMFAVKQHYLSTHPEFDGFRNAMTAFVIAPQEQPSLMPNAVERFGRMTPLNYPMNDLNAIAAYVWHTEFDHPKESARSGNATKTPLQQGQHYAMTTKALLGKRLMAQLNEKGTLEALAFCNVQAIPYTDSMATHHGARIRRVSDQPRNPENRATGEEMKLIKQWKKQLARGEELSPVLREDEGKTFQFYAPITTNAMCLQCHGVQNDIQPEVRSKLSELYPADEATGYETNQLRGIWSVQWQEQ